MHRLGPNMVTEHGQPDPAGPNQSDAPSGVAAHNILRHSFSMALNFAALVSFGLYMGPTLWRIDREARPGFPNGVPVVPVVSRPHLTMVGSLSRALRFQSG